MDTIDHINPDGFHVTINVSDKHRAVSIGDNVTIHEDVLLYSGTVIGNDVIIHRSCQFGYGVRIGNNSRIGPYSHLTYTTVGEYVRLDGKVDADMGVRIGDQVRIGFDCRLGPNVVIEDDVSIGERFTTVSYTTIKAGAHIGNFVHIDRDTTIGAKVVIDHGVSLFGKHEVPDGARVSYQAPLIQAR